MPWTGSRDAGPVPAGHATLRLRFILPSSPRLLVAQVKITPIPGKRVDHAGIRVQLVGEIELASERGYPHEFLSLVRDLAPPGDLPSQQAYSFSFDNVEMQHDSYLGLKVRLRYLLRVTVARGLGQSTMRDYPFWVRNSSPAPPRGEPIKVGVCGGWNVLERAWDREWSLSGSPLGASRALLCERRSDA